MLGGSSAGWMWIWPALVVVGLLIIGYVTVRLARGGWTSSAPGGCAARQILADRYARGEIDEDEYRRRRSLLP